jgi:hypothetical protein
VVNSQTLNKHSKHQAICRDILAPMTISTLVASCSLGLFGCSAVNWYLPVQFREIYQSIVTPISINEHDPTPNANSRAPCAFKTMQFAAVQVLILVDVRRTSNSWPASVGFNTSNAQQLLKSCTQVVVINRQDKTRQDKTRQDKTRQDKTRQDKTRQDKQYGERLASYLLRQSRQPWVNS